MRALLELAAPVVCLACGREADDELCGACAGRIVVVRRPFCERCGTPGTGRCNSCSDLEGFHRARSLVVFAEPSRGLTLALKRRGRRALASSIGVLVADLVRAEGLEADAVAFVPAGRRARRRGFDPARLVAKAVARELGRPLSRALRRAGDGPRQADVRFGQRRDNVRGRFAARPVSGSFLLVDDVYTTGATAEACALALLEAGAGMVNVATWARTLRRLTPMTRES